MAVTRPPVKHGELADLVDDADPTRAAQHIEWLRTHRSHLAGPLQYVPASQVVRLYRRLGYVSDRQLAPTQRLVPTGLSESDGMVEEPLGPAKSVSLSTTP